MAFMNKQERDAMLDKMNGKSFQQIRGIVNSTDKKARIAYYRNVQETGKWMTRYIMEGAGTIVTLTEILEDAPRGNKKHYRITEIELEPTDENRL